MLDETTDVITAVSSRITAWCSQNESSSRDLHPAPNP